MTTDEWVTKLNAIGRELNDCRAIFHPSAWEQDPTVQKLKQQWRELARQPTEERQQLELRM